MTLRTQEYVFVFELVQAQKLPEVQKGGVFQCSLLWEKQFNRSSGLHKPSLYFLVPLLRFCCFRRNRRRKRANFIFWRLVRRKFRINERFLKIKKIMIFTIFKNALESFIRQKNELEKIDKKLIEWTKLKNNQNNQKVKYS